ncbi:ribonuclease H2, subunit B [Lophiotrema nucula]|uniref:Ribonuclease H2 subunit B n=1 Tax=Lophiotrema nucula TaxID=690887 RepID=A0A6A5YY36_9PLEO|nr:ribonuclease H2, subunit B [Lophiotrema nucula]
MARTRSKPTAKASKETTPPPATSNAKALPPSVENVPKLFVLPKDTSKDARIVTLDNPASGTPSRYFFCPEKGFYEFTRIAAPKKACRSWLITSETSMEDEQEEKHEENGGVEIGSGYVTKSADLFLATPIDLLFLILPALAPKSAKDTKQLFLSLDDYLDKLSSSSAHWKALLSQYPSLRAMIEKRMDAFCDTVDAGDDSMYRLSNTKLLQILVKKAERICATSFPSSMEERFIKPTLDVPVMSIKREESNTTQTTTDTSSQPQTETQTEASDTQPSSTPSTTLESQTSFESTSTTATSIEAEDDAPPALQTPPTIPPLLRLRTTLSYILSSYIPSPLRPSLLTLLSTPQPQSSTSLPDLQPLETHLSTLAKLKSQAAALRSISDNISRKRAFDDEDADRAAEREEKKRRKEEEEKRKKGESRGVKALKKVDVSGMKKLSSFFAVGAGKK